MVVPINEKKDKENAICHFLPAYTFWRFQIYGDLFQIFQQERGRRKFIQDYGSMLHYVHYRYVSSVTQTKGLKTIRFALSNE